MLSAHAEHLADARAAIERCAQRIEKQAKYSEEKCDPREARGLRLAANLLRRDLIGGQGCVIAAFDERLPALVALREDCR